MEILDAAPTLPRFAETDQPAILAGRRPSLGEFLDASVSEGWWNTTLGTGGARGRVQREAEESPQPLSREEWDASPYRRQGLAWDERMTEGRAAAMARIYDENRYRRALMAARDPGAFEVALGFGGQLVGSIPDPVNFVPVAGPVTRALRAGSVALDGGGIAARALGGAARALEGPGIGAAALRGGVEGLAGNAMAAPFVYGTQAQFGDEVTFGKVATDLALGALIGAGFGAGARALAGIAGPDPRAAVRTLDAVAADLAAGRAPEVPAAIVARAVEDAVVRSAPVSAEPLIRTADAPSLAGLPTRPDGSPLTRDEFEAELATRRGTTVEAERAALAAAKADAARAEAADAKADTLVRWIIRNGGLRDDGGEVLAMLGGTTRTRPGLISRNGMAPDVAALRAREAGFFGDFTVRTDASGAGLEPDRLMPSDLFDAIDAELRGNGARRAGSQGIDPAVQRDRADRMEQDHEAVLSEAYDWYRQAVEVQRRLASLPQGVRDDVAERASVMEFEGGMPRDQATVRAAEDAATADPILAAAMREIEAMRADGRFTDADEAVLRAGDEVAAETIGVAKGLEEAAVCMIQRAA